MTYEFRISSPVVLEGKCTWILRCHPDRWLLPNTVAENIHSRWSCNQVRRILSRTRIETSLIRTHKHPRYDTVGPGIGQLVQCRKNRPNRSCNDIETSDQAPPQHMFHRSCIGLVDTGWPLRRRLFLKEEQREEGGPISKWRYFLISFLITRWHTCPSRGTFTFEVPFAIHANSSVSTGIRWALVEVWRLERKVFGVNYLTTIWMFLSNLPIRCHNNNINRRLVNRTALFFGTGQSIVQIIIG